MTFKTKWELIEDNPPYDAYVCNIIEDEDIWTNTKPYSCKNKRTKETYILHLTEDCLWN